MTLSTARAHRSSLHLVLLGLAAGGFGCMLPPQTVDVPLTGELDGEPRSDSSRTESVPVTIDAEVPDPERDESPPSIADAETGETEVPGEDPDGGRAAVVAVEESPTGPIERVGSPPSDVDLQAIERDGEAEFPPAVETDLVLAAPTEATSAADAGAAAAAAGTGAATADDEEALAEAASFRVRAIDTADGLRMVYRVGGKGAPVVLVHGWCGNADQWDEHARALATTHRVYAVDLLGHGESRDQVRADWTIHGYGADVARLIEDEDLDEVVLVGHAMGGQVALEVAAAVPGRVVAIIGVDSLQRLGVDPNPERLDPYVATFASDYERSMKAFIDEAVDEQTGRAVRDRILQDAMACSPEVAVGLMRHFGVHDPKFAARTIDCRVVCINSDSAPTDVDGNRALLTSFDASIMKDVGHWPHLEAPQSFIARLRSELARVGPRQEEGVAAVLQSLSPVLYCENVEEVRDFYVDGLAFEEIDRRPRESTLAPDFVALRREGATVMLQSLATLRSDLPEVAALPRDGVLFLRVTNLDKELVRLGEGVEVAVPERRLSSGSRQIVVKDPAGTFVVLQQAPGVPAR